MSIWRPHLVNPWIRPSAPKVFWVVPNYNWLLSETLLSKNVISLCHQLIICATFSYSFANFFWSRYSPRGLDSQNRLETLVDWIPRSLEGNSERRHCRHVSWNNLVFFHIFQSFTFVTIRDFDNWKNKFTFCPSIISTNGTNQQNIEWAELVGKEKLPQTWLVPIHSQTLNLPTTAILRKDVSRIQVNLICNLVRFQHLIYCGDCYVCFGRTGVRIIVKLYYVCVLSWFYVLHCIHFCYCHIKYWSNNPIAFLGKREKSYFVR